MPHYPAAVDTFAAKTASTEGESHFGLLFGRQDLGNFYFTRYSGGNKLQIWRVEGKLQRIRRQQRVQRGVGTIYDYVVDWVTDGTITLELSDGDGNVLGSVSAQDATGLVLCTLAALSGCSSSRIR